MMEGSIFLVDVDGVLLPKEPMWRAIGETFESIYPNRSSEEIRAFYMEHKTEKPNVDDVIEAGFPIFGHDFWKPFYETDYQSLVTPGWEDLKRVCSEKGIRPLVFSEGSVGRRNWMPEYIENGFQPWKVQQLSLGVPAYIFQDKVNELHDRVKRWNHEGVTKVIGLDDSSRVVSAMKELGVEAYHYGENEHDGRPIEAEQMPSRVDSLGQMARIVESW